MQTTTDQAAPNSSSGKKWAVAIIVVIAIVALVILTAGGSSAKSIIDELPTATVTRGDMIITLTETGEIRAAEKTTIANEVRWQVVIAERVDEGEYVKKGDLIIRFECKELLDAIDSTMLDVTSSENNYIQAQETIELTHKELANKIAQAEGDVENKRNEMEKFLKHEKLQELQKAQSELTLAKQDLAISKSKLEFMLKVNETEGLENSYSQSSIDTEQLKVDRQTLQVSTAEAEVEKLKLYEHPRRQRELELALEKSLLELERAKLEAQSRQRTVEVDEKAKLRRFEQLKEKLADLEEQKEKLEVRAESSGVIIYDSGRHWDPADLSVGATVYPRRQLMRIPNTDTLKVYSRIYEGVSEDVKKGTPALIRMDSRDGLTLKGKVDKVSPVASSENRWLNPNLKIFPIEIALDEKADDLKPGSSATVELILDELSDVLKVNIAAIFTEQEDTYVWKVEDGVAHRCDVEIGRSSSTEVEIISGLEEGDIVLLTPPDSQDTAQENDSTSSANPLAPSRTEASSDE